MTRRLGLVPLALGGMLCAAIAVPPRAALGCGGFSEWGGSCDDASTDAANEARWMLKRVVAAVQADERQALGSFSHGASGFRTQDIYVFCVGPDGVMSAHPNPDLAGRDALHLHDANGKAFIQEMVSNAREGEIGVIRYLFPRPGTTQPVPKTTYYTRVKDQVCGVGYYDAAESSPARDAPGVSASRSDETALRRRLDAAMPAALRPDWTAFLRGLDSKEQAQGEALAKARESVQAAARALAAIKGETATASSR